MSGSMIRGLVGLLSAGVATSMIQDSAAGTAYKRQQQLDAVENKKDYLSLTYKMGKNTGNPGMQGLAERFKQLMLYGPGNLNLRIAEAKIKTNSLVNDVIAPNIAPIALGLGGICMAFGAGNVWNGSKIAGSSLKAMGGVVRGWGIPQWMCNKMPAPSIAKHLESFGKWWLDPKKPENFFTPIIAAGLGAFGITRFKDNYTDTAQDKFYRDFTQSNTREPWEM